MLMPQGIAVLHLFGASETLPRLRDTCTDRKRFGLLLGSAPPGAMLPLRGLLLEFFITNTPNSSGKRNGFLNRTLTVRQFCDGMLRPAH
jgi:hypothetical protein